MESLPFIGTESSELSGKANEDLLDKYLKNYGMIRRKAMEPSYIITCLYPVIWVNLTSDPYKQVVIGDWY